MMKNIDTVNPQIGCGRYLNVRYRMVFVVSNDESCRDLCREARSDRRNAEKLFSAMDADGGGLLY